MNTKNLNEKNNVVELCKKCASTGGSCHNCGRLITLTNPIASTFIKNRKLHQIGKCCSD